MTVTEAPHADANGDEIRLEIATPKGMYVGAFPKTAKIADVIAKVVAAKHLDGGDKYQLVFGDKILEPVERPLVSFHLPNPAKLNLVATGSGV